MDGNHRGDISTLEDHPQDTRWRKPGAPGVRAQHEGESGEHSGREGHVREPGQTNQ